MIILGKRCIYHNKFWQKLDISNFKQNLFNIRLVESNMAINVGCDLYVKEKSDKTYVWIYWIFLSCMNVYYFILLAQYCITLEDMQ